MRWAVEIKYRAERRAGELITEQQKAGKIAKRGQTAKKVQDLPTLGDLGITHNQSSQWQKVAAISEERFEAVIKKAKDEDIELTSALLHRSVKNKSTVTTLTSSETNEWYTPARYIEAARAVLGKIDLDPASNEHANKTVKAAKFYDEHRDGLKKEWSGRVWLNPPYGDIGPKFIAKLLKEFKDGEVLQAILLVNANTDTKWFKPLFDYVICFTDHRVKFENPSAEKDSPTHGSAFVFLGSDARKRGDDLQNPTQPVIL